MGKIKVNHCKTQYKADYVVVGMGTSGCTIAGLLSKDHKTSVIGVEGGGYNILNKPIRQSYFAGIEYGLPNNYFPEYFWQHKPVPNGSLTGPQPPFPHNTPDASAINCSLIPDNQKDTTVGDYTTGRIFGGGSSINGEQYVRGTDGEWNQWVKYGGKQWSAEKVTKRYKELENYLGLGSPKVHGYHGPMDIRQAPAVPTSGALDFVAAVEAGAPYQRIPDDDYNNPATPIGPFARWELFQKPNGNRASAAIDFLGPQVVNPEGEAIDGRRLLILFRTLSNTIIWEGSRAVGLRVIKEGQSIEIYAKKKLIITQGVYSADLLQRSGVGPAGLLKCLGIPVVYDNPNVGKHWQNQLLVPATFSTDPKAVGLPPNDPDALYTGGAFFPPLLPGDDHNRRGYQFIGAWIQAPADIDPIKATALGATQNPPYLLTFLISYLQPHSKGVIRIQTKDPTTISLVDNNYFGDPRDMEAFIQEFKVYVVDIVNGFNKTNQAYQLVQPKLSVITDSNTNDLTNYILSNYNHTHHWQGSNRMGKSPEDSVVDGWGNVWGVKDLIVADDSIAPVENDGNTNAPAFMIGYTIAKHLVKERK